jgi:uncharacterized protein (TIGR03084 family)
MADLADDLGAETAELTRLLDGLPDDAWLTPTPAPGWSIADQVSHLAYFDDMATLAATDRAAFEIRVADLRSGPVSMTERVAADARALTPAELRTWFDRARTSMLDVYRAVDPSLRVPWFGPDMSAPAALTARIMETWAHGQDVADALGVVRTPTVALRQVAHLCVRALPNSFRTNDLPEPEEPVRVELTGPAGEHWEWGPADAVDRVTGDAVELCLVATQRRHPADTDLVVVGPVAQEWLTIAQAYAGPPGSGREPQPEPEPGSAR